MARRQMRNTYLLHGLGKHTLEEQADFARRDFEALDRALSASDYIAGPRLTVYDFAVASLLAGIYDQHPDSWINPIAADFARVREYAQGVQAELGVYAR